MNDDLRICREGESEMLYHGELADEKYPFSGYKEHTSLEFNPNQDSDYHRVKVYKRSIGLKKEDWLTDTEENALKIMFKLQDEIPSSRRVYISNATKQKAYRERMKEKS